MLLWFTDIINGTASGPDLGAFHSSDIPFVFGASSVLGDPSLSINTQTIMQQYWSTFATTGTPSSSRAAALGVNNWPIYHNGLGATDREYLKIQNSPSTDYQLKQAKCDYWENNKTIGFFN